METTLIGIGGINLQINLPDASYKLENGYLPFRADGVPAMGEWHVHHEPIPDVLMLSGDHSRTSLIRDIRQLNDKFLFRLWWKPDDPYPWKAAVMEPADKRGDIWLNRRDGETISSPLSSIDLLLFPYHLLSHGGILFHAAAVKTGTAVYIFPAPAGGGKSTWSGLSSACTGWRVLGEDKVIVRKVGDSYQVFGTPWNPRTEYHAADNAPLRGIYFLHHSRENRISEMGKAEIAQKLLQASSLPFQRTEELDRALTIIEEIAQTVPAYQFGFRPDQSALDFFQSFI